MPTRTIKGNTILVGGAQYTLHICIVFLAALAVLENVSISPVRSSLMLHDRTLWKIGERAAVARAPTVRRFVLHVCKGPIACIPSDTSVGPAAFVFQTRRFTRLSPTQWYQHGKLLQDDI